MKYDYESKARELAKRCGYTIRRIPNSTQNPNGFIKVVDQDGNEKSVNSMYSACDIITTFAGESFTTPIYEVGQKRNKVRIRIAAKNADQAKRRFCKAMRIDYSDPVSGASVIEAKKMKGAKEDAGT